MTSLLPGEAPLAVASLAGALPGPWRALLGGLVYLFLLQVLWLFWRDHRRARGGVRATLRILAAPAEALAAGWRVGDAVVVGNPATLGRAPGNTVVIPADTVSLHHLRLVYRNGGWWVEDLGSTNGTFVGDQPVRGATRLAGGDVVGCGPQVRLQLDRP